MLRHPIVLAAIVTVLNAAKPAVVDDAAYLTFARQIAAHPTDPYGFDLFWYKHPEPAMTILCPPVVPYWLAAGMSLFGEELFVLKLWLFPFPLVLGYAARSLLRRFARGAEGVLLPAVMLGPGVLPFVNVMLDVPALALQTAAVALFVRATENRRSTGLVIVAGLFAGLACQTKYTALCAAVVIVWYGLTHRRFLPAVGCVAVCAAVFAAWELFLVQRYGVSHFLFHLTEEVRAAGPEKPVEGVWAKLAGGLARKGGLLTPMLGHLGATAWWVGTLGWLALGTGRRAVAAGTIVAAAAAVAIVFAPGRWLVLIPGPHPAIDRLTVNGVLFTGLGGLAVVAAILTAVVSLFRRSRGPAGWRRRDRVMWFLAGWLAIEIASSLAMTPFPAARRVVGVSFVLVLVVARFWVRARRIEPSAGGRWIPAAAVGSGLVLAGIDTFDAFPERDIPRHAAAIARDRGWTGTGWYDGHWGFQYYSEREGMKPIVPGRTELRPGDWIVMPIYPDLIGFYRPSGWPVGINWDGPDVAPVEELVWDDVLSAQTIPNFYGGKIPVVSRKAPRLRVIVFRVVRPCRA